jgi:hypothetical protein
MRKSQRVAFVKVNDIQVGDHLLHSQPTYSGEIIDFVTYVGPGSDDEHIIVDNFGAKMNVKKECLFFCKR